MKKLGFVILGDLAGADGQLLQTVRGIGRDGLDNLSELLKADGLAGIEMLPIGKFTKKHRAKKAAERRKTIWGWLNEGRTITEVSTELEITYARAWQLVRQVENFAACGILPPLLSRQERQTALRYQSAMAMGPHQMFSGMKTHAEIGN